MIALLTMAALMIGGMAASASAQSALANHVPGSIHSVDEADQLLQQVAQQRQQIEVQNAIRQNACYDRFFVSACLAKVGEQHRVALSLANQVEIDANVYKRRAKVEERDQNLEAQRRLDIQDREDRARQQAAREASSAEKMRQHEQDAKSAAQREQQFEGAAQQRVIEHQLREQRRAAGEAAAAAQRAENVRKFNQKGLDAAKRQQAVAQKKAEKAEKAEKTKKAAKAEQDATGNASGAATPPDAASPGAVLRP